MKNFPPSQLAVRFCSIVADLLTVVSIVSLTILLRKSLGGEIHPGLYFRLWPFLILFWVIFEKLGLYNGTSVYSGACLGPVEELRRIFYGLGIIFIMLGVGNYCYQSNDHLYSCGILISSFLLCLVMIPAQRVLFRKICSRLGCWGVPVIVIGSGETARNLFNTMNRHPEYGLRPIGYFTDHLNRTMPKSARFLGAIDEIPEKSVVLKAKYAILAKEDGTESPYIQEIIKRYGTLFPHLLLVPKTLLHTETGVTFKNIGGITGIEIRHNLQIPSIYRIKKTLDYLLTIPVLISALPMIGLIALWVKLDSPGPAFFKHRRVTKNGRQINIYKFRTMEQNASSKLEEMLQRDPTVKKEWELYGKLEKDPRATRAGAWLRKTSLDELPQLFNILQGKLTLVGPRPLIEKELGIYGEAASLFNRVLPGLTGLWQVSGRNELTYNERAKLDLYYVNNWSVWLDIYILAKTVYAVLFRCGVK
jgi:Undecaprenyl-phosphate galactose phosphotransferase WbaP